MTEDITPNRTVRICAQCQKEFNLDDAVKKASEQGLKFSHGICNRHMTEAMKSMGIDDAEIEKKMKTFGQSATDDLKEHPNLVNNYKNGIFTPEQLQKYQQSQQPQSAETLKEKWSRLNKVLGN